MSHTALLEPTPPAADLPAASPTVTLPDLILVRLVPERGSASLKKLRDDLAVFFRRPPTSEQVAEAVAALRGDGYVTPKGQRATDAGRARAMMFLGIETLPPKANWGAIKAKYLVPLALGLAPGSDATTHTLRSGDNLAAFLLKRKLGLPVGTGATLNAVLEAIVCRELGYPDHAKLESVRPLVLAKAIRSDTPIESKAATKIVPRVLLNLPRGGFPAVREAALAGWLDGESAPSRPLPERVEVEEPFDLEMFANTVKSVARTCPTGRFGDNKVFINHVWAQLHDEPQFAALGLAGFKQKLVEANRSELLCLSRADLVQLMDPNDVRESEITYLTATFHFILVEKD